jgi:O-acetyl-ADP-ribose deacetylase (regulator of RNase III)
MMIKFIEGNLLECDAEALVNTVNTVGVMGKGVALMFKDAFPENFQAYEAACKAKEVQIGRMFVFKREQLIGPKWIINFPTKDHWRFPSKLEWIVSGLDDLKRIIIENNIKSIALPPLGAGNGGLEWNKVKSKIEGMLGSLPGVEVIVYEPTEKYQNVSKRAGVEKLTPPRALIAELVRRYWILGIECTLLEVQKLGYFLERHVQKSGIENKLDFRFVANKFGPYSDRLTHMLEGLDGSYLHCDKRLADSGPFDVIHFDDTKRDRVSAYLTSAAAKPYASALEATSKFIDGFESPLSMEILSSVDWLLNTQAIEPNVEAVKKALKNWPGEKSAAERKIKLFDDRMIGIALTALANSELAPSTKELGSRFAWTSILPSFLLRLLGYKPS